MTDLSSDQKRLTKLIADRDAIDDSSLNEYRELEQSLTHKLDSARIRLGQRQSSIEEAKQRKKEAEEDRQKIEKRLTKTDSSADKLNLSRDTQYVFKQIVERLVKEELKKVSDEMNRIFLEMNRCRP